MGQIMSIPIQHGIAEAVQHGINTKTTSVVKTVVKTADAATQTTPQIVSPKDAWFMLTTDYPTLDERKFILKSLKDQLSGPSPPIDAVIEAGLLPVLIENLSYKNLRVQYESYRILSYVVAGTTDQVQKAVDAGVIPAFIHGVGSNDVYIVRHCWWGLSRVIRSGGITNRDKAIQCGIMDQFVIACKGVSSTTNKIASELSKMALKLCEYKNPQISREVQSALVPCLLELIKHPSNHGVIENASFAITFLCTEDDDQLVFLNGFNVVDAVVKLLEHPHDDIVDNALSACCSFVRGSTKQAVLDHGFLGYLPHIFSDRIQVLHDAACNAISHILIGDEYHVQAVFDAGLIPYIIRELEHDDFDLRSNAVWCLNNISLSESTLQVLQLGRWGVIPGVTPLLAIQDDEFQRNVLVIIGNVLSAADDLELDVDLYQFMNQFQEKGGLGLLDTIRQTGTNSMREIAEEIYDFYTDFGPCAAA